MFTGIVEAAVPLTAATRRGGLMRLSLVLPAHWADVKLGDSIAVNGCCLTVAALAGAAKRRTVSFDAIPETLKLTNLGEMRKGSRVNLERAMLAGARLDGHMVQGHVDAVGTLERVREAGGERRVTVVAAPDFCSQCIWKGSVCLDGISLTIAELKEESFTVAIIPHTWEVTALAARTVGSKLNLEADMVGKYVRRQLDGMALPGAKTR